MMYAVIDQCLVLKFEGLVEDSSKAIKVRISWMNDFLFD